MGEPRVTRKAFLKRVAGATALLLVPMAANGGRARAAERPAAQPVVGEPGYEARVQALLTRAGSRSG